jgi:benzoyl-CoA reductase/2-hydroxyglutaryl-CoA dehydratase subunit BcrC/BadD/HgdB
MDSRLKSLIRGFQSESRAGLATSGRKVVGTLCLAAPAEIAEAVGAIPVRLLYSSEDEELRGGRFLSSDSCSFCKAVLGGLDLADPKPDAVLGATTCDQMRRNLEIIARDLHIPVFMFNAPRTSANPMVDDFIYHDLLRLFGEISDWAGVPLDVEKLSVFVQRRHLLRRRIGSLLAKREALHPTLSGSEFQTLMAFYQNSRLDDFERNLPEIEAYLSQRDPIFRHEPLRIGLLGSCLGVDDDQVIELVEETGQAAIVYDAVCTGSRVIRRTNILPEDPIAALAQLYHHQVLCPHKRPNDSLLEQVTAELKQLGVQGVIFKTLKFCHPWGFEARRFKETLGLPFLHLDHDYSPSASGQLRTRIHAFMEQLSLSRPLQ